MNKKDIEMFLGQNVVVNTSKCGTHYGEIQQIEEESILMNKRYIRDVIIGEIDKVEAIELRGICAIDMSVIIRIAFEERPPSKKKAPS